MWKGLLGDVSGLSLDDGAHLVLLLFDRARSIDHAETEFVYHPFILVADHSLEQLEALFDIIAQAQIHSGLVVFQSRARAQDSLKRNIERHSEIKSDSELHRESVYLAHPTGADPSTVVPS